MATTAGERGDRALQVRGRVLVGLGRLLLPVVLLLVLLAQGDGGTVRFGGEGGDREGADRGRGDDGEEQVLHHAKIAAGRAPTPESRAAFAPDLDGERYTRAPA